MPDTLVGAIIEIATDYPTNIAVAGHSLWRVKNLMTVHNTAYCTFDNRNDLAQWMRQQSRQQPPLTS